MESPEQILYLDSTLFNKVNYKDVFKYRKYENKYKLMQALAVCSLTLLKGGVGNSGETSSSALDFENTQPEKICHFLTEPLLQHT